MSFNTLTGEAADAVVVTPEIGQAKTAIDKSGRGHNMITTNAYCCCFLTEQESPNICIDVFFHHT